MPARKNAARTTCAKSCSEDDNHYDIKGILHFVVLRNGQMQCLVQWKGYEGHPDEFAWVPPRHVSAAALAGEWEHRGLNPVKALQYVRQDFNAHRRTHGFDIDEYKRVALDMAKARRFRELGELLSMPLSSLSAQGAPPLPIVQAAHPALPAPTQASSSVAVQAPQATVNQLTVLAPQVTTRKAKAKPQSQLGRRKSTRQLEKQAKADAMAVTQEASSESAHVVKAVLESPPTSIEDEHEVMEESTHVTETSDKIRGLGSKQATVGIEETELVPSKDHGKKLRSRKSVSFSVDDSGSPMPEAVSSVVTVAVEDITTQLEEVSLDVLPTDAPDESKENIPAPLGEVKPDRKKRKSIYDWFPDWR